MRTPYDVRADGGLPRSSAHQMRPLRMRHKFRHAIVAGAGNQAFAPLQQHLNADIGGCGLMHQINKGQSVVVKIFAIVAGGHDNGMHIAKGGGGQHDGNFLK